MPQLYLSCFSVEELRQCHITLTAIFTSCFLVEELRKCHITAIVTSCFLNKSFRNLGSVMSQPYLHHVFQHVFQKFWKCHIYIIFYIFFLASLWEASCHSPITYHFSTRLWGSGMSQPYYCTSYLHLVFQHIFAEELNQFQIQLWLCFVLFGFCSLTSPPLHGLPLLLLQASNN